MRSTRTTGTKKGDGPSEPDSSSSIPSTIARWEGPAESPDWQISRKSGDKSCEGMAARNPPSRMSTGKIAQAGRSGLVTSKTGSAIS